LTFLVFHVRLLNDRAKMTRIIFAVFFFMTALTGKIFSQQEGFLVLIDDEHQQPFYVRLGNETINSSELGHLAIPHLTDSTYRIALGFQNAHVPELEFDLRIKDKDLGYQLRNLGDKGWALYNWQTLEYTPPVVATSSDSLGHLEVGIKKDDPFSRLMASVVNDTLVMYTSKAAQHLLDDTTVLVRASPPKAKPDSLQTLAKKTDSPAGKIIGPVAVETNAPRKEKEAAVHPAVDTSFHKEATPGVVLAAPVPKKNETTPKPIIKHEHIRKLVQRPSKIAMRLVFLYISKEGEVDTITMLIPFEKDTSKKVAALNKPKAATATPPSKNTDTLAISKTSAPKTVGTKKPFVPNPVCKNLAADYDVDVVRVNILTANTLDAKLAAAKKIFTTMCFSVKQIRVLGDLFADDKGKLAFFQTAYPYTSDREHFGLLADSFTDSQYGAKLNALIK
jgi:hypothetical protein